MKKWLCAMLFLLLFIQVHPTFAFEVDIQPEQTGRYLGQDTNDPPSTVEIDGVKYMWYSLRSRCHPVKYDPATYDFFMGFDYAFDCIFTGEYYIIRNAAADYKGFSSKLHRGIIDVYNKDFKLVCKPEFGGYVTDLGYSDGMAYCNVNREGTWMSTDMVNWKKPENNIVFEDKGKKVCERTLAVNGEAVRNLSISGSDFYNVAYEDSKKVPDMSRFADYIFDYDQNQILFSNDCLYAVTIPLPEDNQRYLPQDVMVYEYGDDLVVDWYMTDYMETSYRLRTPKQPIYDALAAIKDAPYVCVNDTILGFEQPPVTESDRTLVPMRFLF